MVKAYRLYIGIPFLAHLYECAGRTILVPPASASASALAAAA